jgi:hypothetical protein
VTTEWLEWLCGNCWALFNGMPAECEAGCPQETSHVGPCHTTEYEGDQCQRCGGYVGSSTRREIAYARSTGKDVEWMFTDPAVIAELVS